VTTPIEILGLPRRTKVEQIRERDLMMPQEVRQMPENKMILLVEGQRPIYGDKLRFFNTQPFKSAEAYSQSHVPDVPTIEYLPHRPVPALTSEYASDGQQAVDQTIRPLPSRPQKHEEPPHEAGWCLQTAQELSMMSSLLVPLPRRMDICRPCWWRTKVDWGHSSGFP
jgi:type IV secretion system protein VirD4